MKADVLFMPSPAHLQVSPQRHLPSSPCVWAQWGCVSMAKVGMGRVRCWRATAWEGLTVSGPPPPIVRAHQISKHTNSQVNRTMFTRVEEKQLFGIAGTVAWGAATGRQSGGRGRESPRGPSKCSTSGVGISKQRGSVRVCVWKKERERELEREREMPKEMEREKKCRGTVTEAQRGGTQVTRH